MLNFHIITIFPPMFDSYLSESILKKALEEKKISVKFYNPTDYAEQSNNPKLKKPIDDKPFGGGPGMVLRAEPFLKAIKKAIEKKRKYQIIYFSPRAKKFETKIAKKLVKNKHLILVAGRYEGIDSRVQDIYPGMELSVGDYVLTGGEIPAMILIDSISRQVSGVLGNFDSREEVRISAGKFYTRPEILKYNEKEYKVPKILLSGDHKKIENWKKKN